ncbi:tail fiber protein [Pectobacterium versatile]|uniref:phage tail protein n=1 Tax=Pectobacterium versatile TaxID=2488639 RepID=UPI00102ECFD6|nr:MULTISPECIES: phage tail protein [Pectobacterium]MBA0162121.1 tail fiber protein [Pectobacterium versatile]MBQ4780188.1 phage tail protein [Pectobacterium versatile]MBQ4784688.1 phage tail protein [Pectobacterium versatile]MCA6916688.1 tail fiber protein [Pectobacterium versatile]MCA6935491.1 tail fiber protein [Pectobacterium versatile]
MANLSEQESWIDGIYQLETSDPVVAGPGGISNRQAEQLASRTAYLKKMQETTGESLQKHLAASDPHSQYAPKNSPVLTGTPTAPTTAQTANNTQIATTAFVKSALAALVNGSPAALDTLQELANALGNDPHFSTTVVNAIADVKTDVANKLNAHASILDAHPQYAPKASPAFTGMPTAPTAASSSNDTQLATTAFVKAAVAALVNGSPAALDTLQELANALGNDPNFSTTVLNTLAGKLAKDQNGADILDKERFRQNVGLVKQISVDDTTLRALMINGAHGLGANARPRANGSTGGAAGCGFFSYSAGQADNPFPGTGASGIHVQEAATYGWDLLGRDSVSLSFKFRQFTYDSVSDWVDVYHSGNLTPSAIGALSLSDIAGIPLPFPTAVAPSGWLKCNGQTFDKILYPVLASRYPSGVLPDLRGEFVRGWDDDRSVDAGRALMSSQSDAIRNITGSGAMTTGAYPGVFSGAFTHSAIDVTQITANTFTSQNGFAFDASRVVPTASENRPRNIAFNYIVRAA